MSVGPASAISFSDVQWALKALGVAVGLAGVFVLVGRSRWFGGRSKDLESSSVVRSLIALWLVLGVLVLALVTLAVDDPTLQSNLVGGITASTGAAVAFYFSSKASDQARQDILTATVGTVEVPDLVGKTVGDAKTLMAGESLKLQVSPTDAGDNDGVTTQDPTAGSTVRPGTAVKVTAVPPSADGASGGAGGSTTGGGTPAVGTPAGGAPAAGTPAAQSPA